MRAHPLTTAVVLAVLAAHPSLAATQAPAPAGQAGGDLVMVERWLTGEFDNFQQFYEAKEAKAAQPHERVHLVITPITAPAVGRHVLLARQSPLNEPDGVRSLHLYSLVAGAADGAVTLRLYTVTDPAILGEVRADPAKATSVKPEQFTPMPGCDVTWRREGDAFVGAMAPGACKATSASTGVPVTVANTYRLTADEFWFSERLTDAKGAVLFGRADGVPYKLMRARQFNCYAALLKEGTTDKYDGMLNVAMHDQGKLVRFRTEDGKDAKYTFELSQLRYNQKVPVMKLALYEDGKPQAFAYSWAETSSQKIGINLRWFQVGCSVK